MYSLTPSPSRSFNPTTPIFLPHTQSQPPVGLSGLLSPSPSSSRSPSHLQDSFHNQINSGPISPTNSGGVRIGRRLIGFGDFPELVDYDLARERAERQRAERTAFGESRVHGDYSAGNFDRQPH